MYLTGIIPKFILHIYAYPHRLSVHLHPHKETHLCNRPLQEATTNRNAESRSQVSTETSTKQLTRLWLGITAKERASGLQAAEEQEVCCGMEFSANVRVATPRESHQHSCPHMTQTR